MRRFHAALFVTLCLPLASCFSSVRGNGEPSMETRNLDGFLEVDSKGSLDVRVEQGDTFAVAVNIDSNLVPLVETRVAGNTLIVSSYQSISTHLPGPHVSIKMPRVSGAYLSGSGHVAVSSVHESGPVALRLSGSGAIDFSGTAPGVDVDVSGSGDVSLAGSTDRISADLAGSGAIDAANLPAGRGAIDVSGSGNVRATINGPADVTLRGSGDIDLYGDVTLQHSSKSGSGDIRVH